MTAPCHTGKVPYATKDAARHALLGTRESAVIHRNTRRLERRCYLCPYCGEWHLSSHSFNIKRRRA